MQIVEHHKGQNACCVKHRKADADGRVAKSDREDKSEQCNPCRRFKYGPDVSPRRATIGRRHFTQYKRHDAAQRCKAALGRCAGAWEGCLMIHNIAISPFWCPNTRAC